MQWVGGEFYGSPEENLSKQLSTSESSLKYIPARL